MKEQDDSVIEFIWNGKPYYKYASFDKLLNEFLEAKEEEAKEATLKEWGRLLENHPEYKKAIQPDKEL